VRKALFCFLLVAVIAVDVVVGFKLRMFGLLSFAFSFSLIPMAS
jgi:hypothetical protein